MNLLLAYKTNLWIIYPTFTQSDLFVAKVN